MIKLTSLLVLTAALSSANTISWMTPAGSLAAGQPVKASAIVVTENGSITLFLRDLLANPTSVGQLVSDFSFTLSSTPTSALNTTSTPSGSLIYIGGSGPLVIDPWNLTSIGAKITLESLNSSGPSQVIIGPGPYTNANGSIDGNGAHNPFLDQTATFTFSVAGITADTSVTGATFGFGTTRDASLVPGICSDCDGVRTTGEVPEPWSAFLIGGGLLAVGILGKFRRA